MTDTAGPAESPAFSPDGSRIAFVGSQYINETGRNYRVFAVPTTGGESLCLTVALDRNCGKVAWTADGGVIFRAEHRGDVEVNRLDANRPETVSPILSGRRQIAEFSASYDGTRLVYIASNPTVPAEVFLSDADGTRERQLTDLNRDWRAEVDRREPEHFLYWRDEFWLDGWIVRPHGFEEGKRYPLLLNIHGGPATQYGTNFFDEFQVYTGAVYAVLFVNPRGSQGYGEAFTRAVVQDWGGGDYADVMAGLDEAIRRYDFIDPERLGVMGGSYGGYLTSWIVSHSNRFKAACSERALNYFPSLFRHQRHRPIVFPGTLRRTAVDRPELVRGALAVHLRGEDSHPAPDHPLGAGLALSDRAGRTALHHLESPRERRQVHPLPGRKPRANSNRPPTPPPRALSAHSGVVWGISGGGDRRCGAVVIVA